jgi:pyruvate/2-oxoglutarate dehydrogenase complex dihydrolipoamide acyltransferase (E2) component
MGASAFLRWALIEAALRVSGLKIPFGFSFGEATFFVQIVFGFVTIAVFWQMSKDGEARAQAGFEAEMARQAEARTAAQKAEAREKAQAEADERQAQRDHDFRMAQVSAQQKVQRAERSPIAAKKETAQGANDQTRKAAIPKSSVDLDEFFAQYEAAILENPNATQHELAPTLGCSRRTLQNRLAERRAHEKRGIGGTKDGSNPSPRH